MRKWLAFTKDEHVHIVPAEGGIPKKVTDFSSGAFAPKWMPDSLDLIVGVTRHDADQLVLTDREGSGRVP